MPAQGVNRRAGQIAISIERQNRNRGAAPQRFAGSDSQQCVRAAQAEERVRFLATNRREFSANYPSAHVMRTIARVLHFFGELRIEARQRKFLITRAHHFEKGWPHKKEECHESGNGIAGQTEDRALTRPPEEKWLARFDRHAPQISLRAS